METPEDFIQKWRAPLETGARILFHSGPVVESGDYCDYANSFVKEAGLKTIGFNWELLDPYSEPGEPRSALGTIADAFAMQMEFPQKEWLGKARAAECARDFHALFADRDPTILSNRFGDLWNPLTDARIEWGFIGFDEERIVLLLAVID